ncbi:MAG: ABC transporter permease [Acidimicrobiaceae bacterium]|nr:ABC transporter permease [Acidimicrobiaceae bacterium]
MSIIRERSRMVDVALRFLPSLAVFVVGLVAWEVWVNVRDVPAYLYPSASEVGSELLDEGPSLAADDLRWTMIEAILGFLLGSFAAVLAAIVFVHAKFIERVLFPWAIVLQTVPIVAVAPLLTIWFGFTLRPKVIIAALICFFPVLVNTTKGFRSISSQAIELMRILSATKWSIFWRLRVPSSLPYVFAGLKVASTLSVIGAIVAEFTGADRGIGFVIIQASYRLDTRLMFAGIALSSAAGVVFFNIIGALERLALRWPDARLEQ